MATNVGRKELQSRIDDYERQKNVPLGMQLGVARETGQVAENTTVHVRIAEAKNLPAKDISGTSDPFCILRVDNQEVARTATVWKDLAPFWGEDFTLHIPRGFHNISLYVYDEDLVGQDDVIGKLSLDHSTLTKSVKGVDGWFPLQQIVKDEEVQGDIEVELKYERLNGQGFLQVQILQARALAAKDTRGTSDPFVKFSFRGQTYKTEVVKKTLFPKWYQSFSIPLDGPIKSTEIVDVNVWDWDRMSQNDFLGQARIRVGNLTAGSSHLSWYRLIARRCSPDSGTQASDGLGSLRVMVLVREDTILPSQYYRPLLDLMTKSVMPPWTEYANVVTMFEEVAVADRTEMATIMVKLYLGQGKVVEFLDFLNQKDLESSEKATLFRGNSFATKANDQFMKVVGTKYLEQVLKPVIDMIYEEKKYCEIDPTKVEVSGRQTPDSTIEANVASTASYVLRAIKAIFGSVRQCPPVMRLAFKRLRKRVEQRFPPKEAGNENVCYLAISGFLFLRFFAPAILSPKLFFLKDTHPDKKTSRTLTLVAKAVQNIGNLGGQLQSAKELFMKPLHPLILDNVPQLKDFLDQIVDIADNLDDLSIIGYNINAPIVIREGNLMKKKGSSLALDVVGSMAMQKRYFWLSRFTLMYAKSADSSDSDRHTLSVQRMLAVEPVDPAAFQTPNTFQIVYQLMQNKTETYYFVARDVNDQQQWISSLRKVCLQNRDMWAVYHPGALRKGKWTCCQQPEKTANGCSKSHGGVILGNYQDPLDPEAEAQTIYSQLWNGFETLRKKYCEDRPFPSPSLAHPPLENISVAVPSSRQQKPHTESGGASVPSHAPLPLASNMADASPKPQRPVKSRTSYEAAMENPFQRKKTSMQAAMENPLHQQQEPLPPLMMGQLGTARSSPSGGPVRMQLKLQKQELHRSALDNDGVLLETDETDLTSCAPVSNQVSTQCEPQPQPEAVPIVPDTVLPAVTTTPDHPSAALASDKSSSSDGSSSPGKRRKRSLRDVLSNPFSVSPGGSPKLLRSQSSTAISSPSSERKKNRSPSGTSPDTPDRKPQVVRLRSLGSVVRSFDLPLDANGALVADQGDTVSDLPSDATPVATPVEANGRRGVLHPQFSNLSINSLDSVTSPSSIVSPNRQASIPTFVAQFLSEDNGQESLPLHQPLRAMSEMMLDELERLYNAHQIFEAMPRRMSVLESC